MRKPGTTFERVIQEVCARGCSPHSATSRSATLLALAYAGLGDKPNALEQARQGVADYENDALIKPLAETLSRESSGAVG